MSTPPDPNAALITAATHLVAAKYYAMASFVMLTYDIFLTFPLELEKIWKQKTSGVTILWFFNRWFFLAAVIPTIASFHDPHFVGERYFRYPGYIATIQRVVIGTIFILRIYCIYGRDWKVAVLIGVFLLVEVIVKLYATIAWGEAVVLPPGFVACVLSVSPENSAKFIIFWVFELATDTLVVFLTILRSFQLRRSTAIWQSKLWQVLVKDGLVYFFVMFATNLITVIMYITASMDLKAVNADFGVMINSVMTARLILNLKTASAPKSPQHEQTTTMGQNMGQWVIGNIGNDFEDQYSSRNSSSYRRDTREYPRLSSQTDSTADFELQARHSSHRTAEW